MLINQILVDSALRTNYLTIILTEDNKEDILYNPGEGYIDYETIKETNDEVEYRR
jgi:hypothetical protein